MAGGVGNPVASRLPIKRTNLERFKKRKPTARAKADQVKALAGQGVEPSDIARKLGIGRSSVYRVLG